MFIPDSDFFPPQIPDPMYQYNNKKRGGGGRGFVAFPFLVGINFTILKIILFSNRFRKKFKPIYKEVFFTQKIVTGTRLSGSGKNLSRNRIRNSGSGSGSEYNY
jgi:hypothetical protein